VVKVNDYLKSARGKKAQLDAGSDERMMLVSRDEQSCLVVSYKDVKNCVDGAYRYDGYIYQKIPLCFSSSVAALCF